jgi:hypothetical protein
MYFQVGSEDNVLAPQTRIPRPGKSLIRLTPAGFKTLCCSELILNCKESAPMTTSLAGAL